MKLSLRRLRAEWFGNIRGDLLAGMVVALALIPEAIAFSAIAGVDPKIGLYASFSMAVIIAIAGGRPGMISAATGSMALLMITLVRDHGLQYLLAATVLTGVLQVLAGLFKLGTLLRFVSRSVMTGFVNSLAILIFMAQLPEFAGTGLSMYFMVGGGLAIIYLFPRITKAVPSPLVCIILLSAISFAAGLPLRTVGDMGELPSTLPAFLLPHIPISLETLRIILPYSLTLAVVGLLESLMTASIIDDLTDTESDKNRECWGQGAANIVTGFFGGMASCAMIGQSVINVKSGGRGRLSTFFAGGFLLFLILVLAPFVKQIPMAALVAVMIMVSIGTFSWSSLTNLRTNPKSSSIVMAGTIVVVVLTHDLAKGVFVGVLMSALFFTRKVSQLMTIKSELLEDESQRVYTVYGQVFFASAESFVGAFDFNESIEKIRIDVSLAHFWDISAVSALDKVMLKFRREGAAVELAGLNKASATIVDKLAVYDKTDTFEKAVNH